ncbi:hypothetical protein [Dactylosporangium sp. CA-092794]|uniref:hypothetical protein n=1 Tax=Dactylosporangium sp. CA-092794 TaxID=3239929 RepID=UPI003D9167ED
MDRSHALGWVCCTLLCLLPVAAIVLAVVARGRGGSAPTGSAGAGGYQAAGWTPPPAPERVRCPACGGSGGSSCSCSNGYEYDTGQPRVHHLCAGSGKIKCFACGGSGFRTM